MSIIPKQKRDADDRKRSDGFLKAIQQSSRNMMSSSPLEKFTQNAFHLFNYLAEKADVGPGSLHLFHTLPLAMSKMFRNVFSYPVPPFSHP